MRASGEFDAIDTRAEGRGEFLAEKLTRKLYAGRALRYWVALLICRGMLENGSVKKIDSLT